MTRLVPSHPKFTLSTLLRPSAVQTVMHLPLPSPHALRSPSPHSSFLRVATPSPEGLPQPYSDDESFPACFFHASSGNFQDTRQARVLGMQVSG